MACKKTDKAKPKPKAKKEHKGKPASAYLGMLLGLVLVFIPEPATDLLGLGMIGYTANRLGWI